MEDIGRTHLVSQTACSLREVSTDRLDLHTLDLTSRCYAALGDVSKARYLEKAIELAEKIEAETVSRGISV